MAKSRDSLSAILHSLCDNVYFQPPGNHRLKYPCIVYELDDLDLHHADNSVYRLEKVYSIQYITRDPDDQVITMMAMLPYCSMSNSFDSENLYHYQYVLYY